MMSVTFTGNSNNMKIWSSHDKHSTGFQLSTGADSSFTKQWRFWGFLFLLGKGIGVATLSSGGGGTQLILSC